MASLESNMWQRIQEGSTVGWSVWYTGQKEDDLSSYDKFKSVARIHSDSNAPCGDLRHDDEIWVVVDRTIDSNTVTTIEQFTPLDWGDDDDYCWFVDCGGKEVSLYYGEIEEVPGEIVYGDYVDYFISGDRDVLGGSVINVNTDNTYNTEWGDAGGWGDTNNQDGYAMNQLSNGKILVIHYGYEDGDGNTIAAAMLAADGTLDTDWGIGGHYATTLLGEYDYHWGNSPSPATCHVFENDDGTFVLMAAGWYHLVSADGDNISAVQYTTAPKKLSAVNGAVWYDDNHDRIICVGHGGNQQSCRVNMMALDPSDLSIDTTWGGFNDDSIAGFVNAGPDDAGDALAVGYGVVKVSDGFIIRHQDDYLEGYPIASKINLGGTNYDTDWATDGRFGAGEGYESVGTSFRIGIDSSENVYTLCGDTVYYTTTQNLLKLDTSGALVDSVEFHDDYNSTVYQRLFVINDILYLFTRGIDPATENIERWNTHLEYIDGTTPDGWLSSSVPTGFIPDEYTREFTETVAVEGQDAYWETKYVGYHADEVCVYADGVSLGTFDVNEDDANDIIGIDEDAYDVIIAGINYYSIYESFPLVASEIARNQRTVTQRVALDLYQTKGVNLGTSMAYSSPIEFADVNDLYTGFKIAEFPRGTFREPVIYLWEYEPYPWCLRAAYMRESIIIPE